LILAGIGVYFLLVNNNGNDAQEIQTFEDMKEGDYFTYTVVVDSDSSVKTTVTFTLKTISEDIWTIEIENVSEDGTETNIEKMTKSEFIAELSGVYYVDFNNPPSYFADLTKSTITADFDVGHRTATTYKGPYTIEGVTGTIDLSYSQKGVLYEETQLFAGSVRTVEVQITLIATNMYV